MKMKMNQIINFLNVYPEIKNNKIKIATAYKLSKCLEFCEQEAKFYSNKLSEIFEKYGQRDETGVLKQGAEEGTVLIDMEKKNECEQEINELLNLEINFDEELLINIKDIAYFELSVDSFNKIKPFLRNN